MDVEEIKATIKKEFPELYLGYDAGFGWVLGEPAKNKPKKKKGEKAGGDYRVEIDHMITPCRVADKMMPKILIGGGKHGDLTHIGKWLESNSVQR
jgi:hypothetical protein